jgi:WD40 repeat protein
MVDCVKIRSTASGEVLAKLDHPGSVWDVAFHRNGRWLLTACGDGAARLWSMATTNLVYPPVKHGPASLNCAAFSPDGNRFATGSDDGTVRLWETRTGKPTRPMLLHRDAVRDLAFRPDGDWLITGGDHGIVRVWSLATGEELGPSAKQSRRVQCVAIDPAGEWILAGGDQQRVLLAPMPALVIDSSRDFQTEVEVLTGCRLTEQRTLNHLSHAEWEELRRRVAGR